MKNKNQKGKSKIYWPFTNVNRSSVTDKAKSVGGQKKKNTDRDTVDVDDVVVSGGAIKRGSNVSKKRIQDAGKQKRPIIVDGAVNFVLEEYSGALRVKFFKKIIFLLFVIIFSVFTVFLLQLLLDFQKSEIDRSRYILSSENDRLSESIVNNLLYKDISNDIDLKLASVDYLLKNHMYWSNLFDFLEVNTLDTVYYTNFENNNSGEIVLYATGESFEDISRQFEVFESATVVKSVSVDSGEIISSDGGDEVVGFNISIVFIDNFFLKNQDLVNIE